MENLAQLPQWVQRHIAHLEHLLGEKEAELTRLSGGGNDANVFAGWPDDKRPIGKNGPICFVFGPDIHIYCRIVDGCLDINASQFITIRPMAANHVEVHLT